MPKKTKSERHPRPFAKGRRADPSDIQAVRALLGEGRPPRERLIECLHTLNDACGHLSAGHIAALADVMGLAQVEVYETATFYAHFTVLAEGEAPPPALTLRICHGPACAMAGAKALLKDALKTFGSQVRVVSAPCQGACDTAPTAMLGHKRLTPASPTGIARALTEPSPPRASSPPALPDPGPIDLAYAISVLEQAGLRGLGGAGFPTHRKWAFFKNAPADGRVLVVNADEGEPGTFKDRVLLEAHLDQVLGGIAIAARALSVQDVFVYLRDEYAHLRQDLCDALDALDLPGVTLHLRRGAGAYVCGEETALIESLEGKRGQPRNRPPYPAQSGYQGRPTVTHNVETLYWLAEIWAHLSDEGWDWYAREQRPRFYSVSGRVRQPGVYLAPSRASVKELIAAADGIEDGHVFKAFLPGGASGGIFPAALADKALDFGVFEPLGGFVGSGALIVLSDHDDPWDVARGLMDFFAHESCGQCTPCRVGTVKMRGLLDAPRANEHVIRDLAAAMADASICGLGQAAPNPALTLLDHFGEDDA